MWYFKSIKLTPLLNGKWKLLKWVSYHIWYKESNNIVIVPAWFETDWASIPRILWTIIWNPFDTKFITRALIHDYIYVTCKRTRKEADDVFLEILKNTWNSLIKSYIMYTRVRLFWKWEFNNKRNKWST
jgi:hypothetical protein